MATVSELKRRKMKGVTIIPKLREKNSTNPQLILHLLEMANNNSQFSIHYSLSAFSVLLSPFTVSFLILDLD